MRKLNEEKLEKLPTFNQQLNDECGRQGTPARDEFHEEALSWYYGQILRSRRQELRMTQKQLADKLGREQSYIARVERGKVDVQLSVSFVLPQPWEFSLFLLWPMLCDELSVVEKAD